MLWPAAPPAHRDKHLGAGLVEFLLECNLQVGWENCGYRPMGAEDIGWAIGGGCRYSSLDYRTREVKLTIPERHLIAFYPGHL